MRQQITRIIYASFILSVVIFIVSCVLDSGSDYFKIGPGDDLFFLSIRVNTWASWVIVMIATSLLGIMDVIAYDYIQPYFLPRIYLENEPIEDWGRNEKFWLIFTAELAFSAMAIRRFVDVMVIVSNFWFAIIQFAAKELTTIIIMWIRVTEKESSGKWRSPPRQGRAVIPLNFRLASRG